MSSWAARLGLENSAIWKMVQSSAGNPVFLEAKWFAAGKPFGERPRVRWKSSKNSLRGRGVYRNWRRASKSWKRSWKAKQKGSDVSAPPRWRVIVVGGHTRSIGKTQLVCDIVSAFPNANWIAGKITQYGHGVCAQNGNNCDCAPDEHVCAIEWESLPESGTDSARFLAAGAKRSFWLRTKQGFLAEGLPLMREALQEARTRGEDDLPPLILESNSLLQFLKPSLYFAVIDPTREDFKDSARVALDRADALVLRGSMETAASAPPWIKLPANLLRTKPSVSQNEGEPLPEPLQVLIERALQSPPSIVL